jgi:hypothetical protein
MKELTTNTRPRIKYKTGSSSKRGAQSEPKIKKINQIVNIRALIITDYNKQLPINNVKLQNKHNLRSNAE